jgi:hypothetical protein
MQIIPIEFHFLAFLEGGSNSVSEDDAGESAGLKRPIFSTLCRSKRIGFIIFKRKNAN